MLYTKEQLIQFGEELAQFYTFNTETKKWTMNGNMAPSMLRQTTEQLINRLIDSNLPPSIDSGDWLLIKQSSHGELYASKNGDTIITGTWDGIGMKYDVHFDKLKTENA